MELSDNQIRQARRLWRETNKTLGEVAKAVNADSHDLSRWLFGDMQMVDLHDE